MTGFTQKNPTQEPRLSPLRLGIGGPVGSGKTALTLSLCRRLKDVYNMAVITNDIYTKEDSEFLTRHDAMPAERIIIESGGDNLAATFSPELSDLTIYVIDVSAGDKIPRKGGPGITKSDLLIINKTDLAPLVGADLSIMDKDAKKMRGDKPFVFSNMKTQDGLDDIIKFIQQQGMLRALEIPSQPVQHLPSSSENM